MTTNRETLKQLKTDYGLTSKRLATLLDVSIFTIDSWLIRPSSLRARAMPDREIDNLKRILKTRKKVNK